MNLLKKALAAGRFNSVPAHILELEQQLHREWQQTRREWARGRPLSELADFKAIELVHCYFLDDADQPDRTLTPDGLAVPLPPGSTYRVSLLADEVGKVPGLMSKREGNTMLIAWDEAGIAKARDAGRVATRKAEDNQRQADEDRKIREQTAIKSICALSIRRHARLSRLQSDNISSSATLSRMSGRTPKKMT